MIEIIMIERTNLVGKTYSYDIIRSFDSNQYIANVKVVGELGSINSQVKVLIRKFGKSASERVETEALMRSKDTIEVIEEDGYVFLVIKPESDSLESFSAETIEKDVNDEATVFANEVNDGFIHFENGRYIGDLKDGQPHGKGKMMWNDHTVYDGEWVDGYMHGNGTMTWPSGKQYIGDWKENVIQGKGKMTYPDGVVYQGMFINGLRHGYGVLTQNDGERFDGEFSNDLITENGIYYDKRGNARSKAKIKGASIWNRVKEPLGTVLMLLVLAVFLIFLFSIAK